jgi:predicted ATPase/class 3 adenylate cyclase
VSRDLPSGTVTFLFTDIEGSTRLLDALGDRYGESLEAHRLLLRQAFAANGGVEVDTQGDAFFVAFADVHRAVQAAARAQRVLATHEWPEGLPVRVRMGLHTGEPGRIADGYVGLDVHFGARICAAAHGGQVLVSQATRDLLGEAPGDGLALLDLGSHRLKDLTTAQKLYQLSIDGLEPRFPPIRTLENRATNLPTQPSPLIGREEEIGQAMELLRREDVRMVTLTGPGGTGKTRLGLQLAAELLDHFADGAFFVNLAPISDPGLVTATIAQTLAVRERAGETLDETLADFLRERQIVLLLDNFEHLLHAAPAVSALLAAAPRLKVLVTSRAPLRVRPERELAVPPLQFPDLTELSDLDALSQYEAVALFVERARGVKADFVVTRENAPAVAEICIRLDGLPLAIELAAARVRSLPPVALLDRLGDRLELLTLGPRDVPVRQQTLRATIDWSCALLSDPQQRLFAGLSVFLRSFDLEGAEAVADPGVAAIDVLEALVENNLLRHSEATTGGARYFMLETIREYAGELLEAAPHADAVRQRHADYVLLLAERAAAVMTGADYSFRGEPERRIQEELPSIRAALEWALGRDEPFALRLAAASSWAWGLSGASTEGRVWLSRALDAACHPETLDGARALLWLGRFAEQGGDFRAAFGFAERAFQLFERLGDQRGSVEALVTLSFSSSSAGELEAARVQIEDADARAFELGDDALRADVLQGELHVHVVAGDYDRAQSALDESLLILRRLGAPRRLWVYQLINTGWIALHRRDFVRAREALLEYLAEESWKNPVGLANGNGNLGLVALYEGDRDEADSRFRRALTHARPSRALPTLAEGLFGLGAVAAMGGDAERAVRLHAAAEASVSAMGVSLSSPEQFIVEQYLEPATASLPGDVRRRARGEGAAMSLDEAVEYALEDGAT